MASTSLKVTFDIDNEENDIWSVYKCIFCNAQSEGNSKILECLHIACNNCILEKKTDSGVQCICLTITKGHLTEYNIIPPNAKKNQPCSENNCYKISKRFCAQCEKHYCRKCSKEHLRNNEDHNPSVMLVYPLELQLALCTSCNEKYVEVYCTTCSVSICAFCHLNLHQEHDFKDLEKLVTKIKTNLNRTLSELKKNDYYLSFCLSQNKKQIKNLNITKKKLIEEEIDMEINKLHKKVNERILELQNLFEKHFLDSFTKISKNKQCINDLKKQHEYNLNLTEALLKHGKSSEIMDLSKTVLHKLKCSSSQNLLDEHTLRLNDIQFSCDGTFEKCVSAIRAVKTHSWNITSSSDYNLSEFDNVELSNNDCLIKNIQSSDSNNKTTFNADSKTTSQLLVECICCKQRNEVLIKCNYCDRHFHNDCHIPALLKNVELPKNWKCTICQDITKYSNRMLKLHEWNPADNVPLHKFELKIIERILLELYCQNVCDNRFRKCLNQGIYPTYYDKVLRCTSLDDVKKQLESKQYTSLFNFLKDIKQIFINALLYYPPSDPHYLAAFELQTTFNLLITKWIPKFDQTKLPQV